MRRVDWGDGRPCPGGSEPGSCGRGGIHVAGAIGVVWGCGVFVLLARSGWCGGVAFLFYWGDRGRVGVGGIHVAGAIGVVWTGGVFAGAIGVVWGCGVFMLLARSGSFANDPYRDMRLPRYTHTPLPRHAHTPLPRYAHTPIRPYPDTPIRPYPAPPSLPENGHCASPDRYLWHLDRNAPEKTRSLACGISNGYGLCQIWQIICCQPRCPPTGRRHSAGPAMGLGRAARTGSAGAIS